MLPRHARLRPMAHRRRRRPRRPVAAAAVVVGSEPVHEAQRAERRQVVEQRPGEERRRLHVVAGPDHLQVLDAAARRGELQRELVGALGEHDLGRRAVGAGVESDAGDAGVRGDDADLGPAAKPHGVGPGGSAQAGLAGHQEDPEVRDGPAVGADRRGFVPGCVGRAEAPRLTHQIDVHRRRGPVGHRGQVDADGLRGGPRSRAERLAEARAGPRRDGRRHEQRSEPPAGLPDARRPTAAGGAVSPRPDRPEECHLACRAKPNGRCARHFAHQSFHGARLMMSLNLRPVSVSTISGSR